MKEWRTFPFRVLRASWGIAIDLRARAVLSARPRADSLWAGSRVQQNLSNVRLLVVDIDQLLYGLSVMAAAIEEKESDGYVIIEVGNVNYTPTDYQPEGLAAAIIGWVSEEFEVDPPAIDVHFDDAENKYVFSL